MKIGDLVKRKFSFVGWQKDNPWLEDEGYTGVVTKIYKRKQRICVHWFINGHKGWYREDKLVVANESR